MLTTKLEVGRIKVPEANTRYRSEQFTSPAKTTVSQSRLEQEQKVLMRVEERDCKMLGYAQVDGTLVVARAQDSPGAVFQEWGLAGLCVGVQ